MPLRVSTICLRSVFLHAGNALSAMSKDDEARKQYEKALPILDGEPRSSRLDWERSSFLVNIGNTYSRQGDYKNADEMYTKAEKLGEEQCEVGALVDGLGLIIVSMRARAFALKRSGKEDEGKKIMREVLTKQVELDKELIKHKDEVKKVMEVGKEEVVTAKDESAAPVAGPEVKAQG
mmetsp:Transcript_1378/g.1860  ORF Transcript_1378/g.1860 Transcript_1378/m.1860 type:complete len:178 (+) Transcript_1378:2-535(+)